MLSNVETSRLFRPFGRLFNGKPLGDYERSEVTALRVTWEQSVTVILSEAKDPMAQTNNLWDASHSFSMTEVNNPLSHLLATAPLTKGRLGGDSLRLGAGVPKKG